MLKQGEKKERIILDSLLFAGTFFFPASIALFLGAIVVLRFRNYYEYAVMALLVDVLYRPTPGATFGLFAFALLYVILSDYVSARVLPPKTDRLK